MAITGDLKVSATLGSYPSHLLRLPSSISKVSYSGFLTGGSSNLKLTPQVSYTGFLTGRSRNLLIPIFPLSAPNTHCRSHQCLGIAGNKLFPGLTNQEAEGFLLDAVKMSFLERLRLAWKILFPSMMARRSSNARIAKQRLKMILFSDRCDVSDEAKQKIVSNIVSALSDFVEIDSQDKVQLNVSTDLDLGTVYSVTVPVKRVKPEYLDYQEDFHGITGVEYKDTGESSGSVDVRFDFFVPTKNTQ